MKKKISLFLGVLFLDLTAFLISSTCVSLSWFNKGFNVKFDNQTGKSLANYFASGDGTKDKPYTITESIHFYNFAWLQYLGEFNKNATGTDSINQKYFRLDKDINMTDIVVPPVGTVTYPFVGNFDGNNKTINNLTVSNTFNDFGAKHPSVVNAGNFETINIVGTFGVVGNLSTKFKYDTKINEIKDFYLDNVTLKTNTSNLLVGIFAGYVNGKINNCGVHYSKIEIANKTQYYLTSDETVNGYINKNISNYTLLGAYNNLNYYWDGEPGFGNSGPDFGGSVDMLSFNKRLTYISAIADKKIVSYSSTSFSKPTYDFYGYTTSTKAWNWNKTNDQPTYYIDKGTILPMNIDTSIAFLNPTKDKNEWETTDFYKKNQNEFDITMNSNTGYLVGSGTEGDSLTIRSKVNTINSNGIENSLNESTYDGKKIKIFTIDTRKNTDEVIVNEDNYNTQFGYSRYKEVKSNFDTSMKGSTSIHGFHFMNSINLEKVDKTINDNNIKICGKTYSPNTYEFVSGGLNFTVEKMGFITSISGGYYNSYFNESLFELFKVERNEGKIASVKKIDKVYKKGTDIIYNYEGDQDNNLGDLIFDFTKVTGKNASLGTKLTGANKAYYFEFPVVPGDYVIGKKVGSDKKNAYLMYLDIGANASSEEEKRTALTNVDFVDKVEENGEMVLKKVDPTNLSKVAFKISGTFDSNYIYYFRREGNTVYYYSSVPAFGFITPSSTGEKKKASSEACES